jgi:hypothetical protein
MRPVDSRMCRVPNGCRGKTDTSSDGRGGVSVVGRLVCVTKMKEEEGGNEAIEGWSCR